MDQEINADVDGFSQFLAEQKALPTLLFWKDAEDFTTLFGVQERAESAKKIFERYLKTGADYEVHASQQAINDIIKSLGEPPEDLFEPLQQDSYNTMLFELFPAFWEAIKKQDVAEGSSKRSQLTTKTTLAEVLKANDLEIHLFAEYCREHMCEESVTFLLECGMYALLFDPLDLETQARRIYELYIDDASEVGLAEFGGIGDKIKSVLEKANVLQKSDVKERKSTRRESTTTGIDSSLFQKAAEEVMDSKHGRRPGKAGILNQMLTLSDVERGRWSGGTPADDRKATKANTLEAMKDKEKLEYLREVISTHTTTYSARTISHLLSTPLIPLATQAANSRGMLENVNFVVEAEAYRLLFTAADRKPRAEAIYATYVAPGADLPVNLPDTMSRRIELELPKSEAGLFDAAVQELLKIIAENVFGEFLEVCDREAAKKRDQGGPGGQPKPPKPPEAGAGGCCAMM